MGRPSADRTPGDAAHVAGHAGLVQSRVHDADARRADTDTGGYADSRRARADTRRTTRRVIVATTTYVAVLPPACTVVVIEGTSLHQCGTTYYQASGTQYVVVNVQ